MHLIEVTPVPCIVCGRGNTPDASGDKPRFVDFERDVNWNDPVVMCEDCVANAGGLVGMMSKDTMNDLKVELKKKDVELHEARVDMDSMKRRAKKLGMVFDKAVA